MKVFFVLTLAMLLFACNCDDKKTDNEVKAKAVYEQFNKHDWKAMAALYADTAYMLDPSMGGEAVKQTREEIKAKYEELAKMFPDVKDSVVNLYSSGHKNVVVEFISTGTDSTGKKFRLPICTIFTIEKGLITRDHTYFDN